MKHKKSPRPKMEIELTVEQGRCIFQFWKRYGGYGHAMICQPVQPQSDMYTTIKIAILNPADADAVADIITPKSK